MGLARLLGGVEVMAGQHHLGAERLHAGHLQGVGGGGGEEGERNSQAAAGIGQCLAPVAGTGPHQAAAGKSAIGGARGHQITRPPALEGPDGVGGFELEGERATQGLAQRFAVELG